MLWLEPGKSVDESNVPTIEGLTHLCLASPKRDREILNYLRKFATSKDPYKPAPWCSLVRAILKNLI